MLGGLMLTGGISGAIIMPLLSDKFHRRKPFVLLALACIVPGLIGMTFATSYGLLLISGFVFGFFLLSSGPIVLQYGVEVTRPVPEGTSTNLLWFLGQVSGIIFIFAMDALKGAGGSMTTSLVVLTGLMFLSFLLAFRLKEPKSA